MHVILGISYSQFWSQDVPVELQKVKKQLLQSTLSSKATTTQSVYFTAFQKFVEFCNVYNMCPLPANPMHVALFLEHKKFNQTKPQSASSSAHALYGIDWVQKMAGFPSVSKHPICAAVLTTAQRQAPRLKNVKAHASKELLQLLLEAAEQTGKLCHYTVLSLCALCCSPGACGLAR